MSQISIQEDLTTEIKSESVCSICPVACDFSENEYGRCKVRTKDGIATEFYGKCSILAIDDIEKRPFFHLTPGKKYLSAGFYGCSMRCEFCLNNDCSQKLQNEDIAPFYTPHALITLARNRGVRGIVFSYNEPTIHYEFLRKVAYASLTTNLILAIKTNGFIEHKIIRDLGTLYDAFNVDIKGDEKFYQDYCGGSFAPVKKTIETLIEMNTWVEISYLVNPFSVDDMEYHKKNAKWLSFLNKNIPIHVLYFYPYAGLKNTYPDYKLINVYNIMSEHLNYVYISNVYKEEFMKYRSSAYNIKKEFFEK